MTAAARPRITPALQERSRETQRRLFEAAGELFADRGVAGTSIANIVARAGVGIGTFYGRFSDKDAFLTAFCERFFEDGRQRAMALLNPEKWKADTVEGIVREFVDYRIRHYQRNRHLLNAVVVHLRAQPGQRLRGSAADFASEFRDLVTALIASRQPRGRKPIDRRHVAFGLTLVEAALKDLYLFNGGTIVSPPISGEELAERLVPLFLDCLND